jgi:hypothetical protein
MRVYDLIKDFGIAPEDKDTVEITGLNPHWVLAVYRLKYPHTFSRAAGGSLSTLMDLGIQIRGKPLVIRSDCQRLHTSGTKTNHLSQLSASLLPGRDYQAEIFPGDHILAWIVDGQKQSDDLVRRILAGEPCNRFMDGFKFMGTVHGCRRTRTADPETGNKQVRFQLTATGFGPLDAKTFYEPHLAEKIPQLGMYFAKLGLALDQLVDKGGLGIDVNLAIVSFLDLFLGRGVSKNFGLPDVDTSLQSTAGLEAPYGFVIPKEVGALIGKTETSKLSNLLSYADVLEVLYGVQSYDDLDPVTADEKAMIASDSSLRQEDFTGGQVFTPAGATGVGSRRYTGTPMMGTFLPTPPQFTDRSVWSILTQYLNTAVNEMYACLRVNAHGFVVPTLVVRQLPFSSSMAQAEVPVTKFLDLPRWKADDRLVMSEDLGRSEALRINFVHVYGDSVGEDYTAQLIRNPPVRDDLDLARNGLQPHMATISCAPTDTINGPQKWMEVLSDIVMGGHMTLTGVVELKGIQAPICPGDNLELNGVVLHIESVDHSCWIDIMGKKHWSTVLNLSHGINAEPRAATTEDVTMYAHLTPDEDRARAGITVDNTEADQDEEPLAAGDFQVIEGGGLA